MDAVRFRKKVLADLFTSPWTLVPSLLGVTGIVAAMAQGNGTGGLAFLGVCALLTGVGSLVTRWIYKLNDISEKAWSELQSEEQQKRERKLDQLDRRLRRDGDPRTEQSLRDLRSIYREFGRDSKWSRRISTAAAVEIATKVERLFHGCLESLESGQELWESAARMRTAEHKESLLKRREGLVSEVARSVDQLAKTVDGVMTLALDVGDSDSLGRIRQELDESLEVARRVEERMDSLGTELGDSLTRSHE
jgi:hypothetical protein